ncbi:6-phosphogluconolactonase [delta proteobacterium NaphS2]|nr:6-phosphogluconolactonase [delta proteobacterium NaphS2]
MIRTYKNLEAVSRAAAEIFVEEAVDALSARGRFAVALSGGETPRRLYSLLTESPIRENIEWKAVHIFWGDERCVPPGDPRSNARMARLTLLDHVPLPAENVHPIPCDRSPQEAAAQYEAEIKAFFGTASPAFDLVLLGLGDNAHTASLFPHTPVLDEKDRWVAEVCVPEQDMHRVTLTAPIINQARQVLFLVSGAEKANALKQVIQGPFRPNDFPAQLIRTKAGHSLWLVDHDAADKLIDIIHCPS